MDASGGGTFHGLQLITAQGVGDSGNRYSFVDSFSTSYHFDSDFEPFTFSQVIVDRVTGLGQAPSYVVQTTTKFTINPNGEVTANVSQGYVECR